MFIRVERGSSVPLSKQIDEQIRALCLSGALKPGDCLPSVRQLAKELAVNVNTVFRVYERLASEKYIEMRQGDGTYVLPPRENILAEQQLVQQRTQFQQVFEAHVRGGLMLGIGLPELRKMLSSAAATFRSDTK